MRRVLTLPCIVALNFKKSSHIALFRQITQQGITVFTMGIQEKDLMTTMIAIKGFHAVAVSL